MDSGTERRKRSEAEYMHTQCIVATIHNADRITTTHGKFDVTLTLSDYNEGPNFQFEMSKMTVRRLRLALQREERSWKR